MDLLAELAALRTMPRVEVSEGELMPGAPIGLGLEELEAIARSAWSRGREAGYHAGSRERDETAQRVRARSVDDAVCKVADWLVPELTDAAEGLTVAAAQTDESSTNERLVAAVNALHELRDVLTPFAEEAQKTREQVERLQTRIDGLAPFA